MIDEHKPEKRVGIIQTAALMAIMTLGSKLLGFVRELTLAGYFGTSYIVDAYVMAQKIPSVLLGGVLSAVGTAYTPVFSSVVETKGKQAGERFTNQMLMLVVLIGIGAILVGMLFSDELISVFAAKFDGQTAELTSVYLKATFLCMLFTGAISLLEAYLNYYGRFLQPILGGYLYDIGIIIMTVISARLGFQYLALGLVIGYLLRAALLLLSTAQSGHRFRLNTRFDQSSRQVFALAVPIFIGSSIYSINTMVDAMLASGLAEGSVASLNYGQLLNGLLLTFSSTVIGAVFYPKITKAASLQQWFFFEDASNKCFSVAAIIAIPFGMGAFVFADQIVQVVYERGAFGGVSTDMTAGAFRFYGLGLAFMSVNSLLVMAFNSLQEVRIPVICSAVTVVFNIGLNLALVGQMQHRGLALATSIATAVNSVMLSTFWRKRRPDIRIFPSVSKLLRICGAALISVLAAMATYRLLQFVWMPRLIYLGIAVLAAVAVYLPLLKLFRIEELAVLKALLGR